MTTAPVTTPTCQCGKHTPTAREKSLLATLQEINANALAAESDRLYQQMSDQANRIEDQARKLQAARLRKASATCPAAGSSPWAKAVA